MAAADLVSQFIKDGVYLRGWSPRTVETYRFSLDAFARSVDLANPSEVSSQHLRQFVAAMRERNLTPGGCNLRIRSVNSYLSWLHEQGHTRDRLRIKQLPNPAKPYLTFSDADLRRVISHVPKGWAHQRAWTLAVLLLDTGMRIGEALSLERDHVDLDAMALRVMGKGQRVRLVPISPHGRKALHRWLTKFEGHYVLGVGENRQWERHNAYHDLAALCRRLGITNVRVNPHAFRHCFAVNYIRNGGDIYRLCRILGHSNISTTQIYLRSMGLEHLQEGHAKFSPLARLA
jgi:integrase/recombinase XerD